MLKRLLPILLLTLLPFVAACKVDISRVLGSVSAIDHPTLQRACTTWSLNYTKGYWITALHCITEDRKGMSIEDTPITVIAVDEANDLALVQGPQAPHLPLSKQDIEEGDLVVTAGYLRGHPLPVAVVGRVTNPANGKQVPGRGPRWLGWSQNMEVDQALRQASGISGGPVVRLSNGTVVAIHQGRHQHIAFDPEKGGPYMVVIPLNSTWRALWEFAAPYRPR